MLKMSSDHSISVTWEVAENAKSLRNLNQFIQNYRLRPTESHNCLGKTGKLRN